MSLNSLQIMSGFLLKCSYKEINHWDLSGLTTLRRVSMGPFSLSPLNWEQTCSEYQLWNLLCRNLLQIYSSGCSWSVQFGGTNRTFMLSSKILSNAGVHCALNYLIWPDMGNLEQALILASFLQHMAINFFVYNLSLLIYLTNDWWKKLHASQWEN